jgi:hypothetical protein
MKVDGAKETSVERTGGGEESSRAEGLMVEKAWLSCGGASEHGGRDARIHGVRRGSWVREG